MVELAGASLSEAIVAGRVKLDDDDGSVLVSLSTMRLTPEQQRRFTAELTEVHHRMADASSANIEARDRGEDPGDEPVQLLLTLSPDVLAPQDVL